MKKPIFTFCFLLFTFLCFAQEYNGCENKFHPFGGAGTGITHLGEIPVHIEGGFFIGINPKVRFSLLADVYNSKQDPQRNWPVFDYGCRLYYKFLQDYTGTISLHGYTEARYATMGREHKGSPVEETELLGGYNHLYPGIGSSAVILLKSAYNETGSNYGWLKLDVGYGHGVAGRLKTTLSFIAVF